MSMKLTFNQKFETRQEITDILGGDAQKGIAISSKYPVILLFTNDKGLYDDYFYPKGTYEYCMYTGIGRRGHQDSAKNNNMYKRNIEVMAHKVNNKNILLFEKRDSDYYFRGEYELTETHQNVQPDEKDKMRRVFVFHLKQKSETYSW